MSGYEISTVINFSTERIAEIAYDVLRVDSEPKRSKVVKEITLSGDKLLLNIKSEDLKNLRVSASSILDHLLLVIETIEAFGPPTTQKYTHYNA